MSEEARARVAAYVAAHDRMWADADPPKNPDAPSARTEVHRLATEAGIHRLLIEDLRALVDGREVSGA